MWEPVEPLTKKENNMPEKCKHCDGTGREPYTQKELLVRFLEDLSVLIKGHHADFCTCLEAIDKKLASLREDWKNAR